MMSDREAGFTLVEMMVAIVIFGILAIAGVGLLRASVNTQAAIDNRLDGLNGQERVALLAADVGQRWRALLGLARAGSFHSTGSLRRFR
jgi:prepilin-type N-terminal cleavage/methylation domain-containing protein